MGSVVAVAAASVHAFTLASTSAVTESQKSTILQRSKSNPASLASLYQFSLDSASAAKNMRTGGSAGGRNNHFLQNESG